MQATLIKWAKSVVAIYGSVNPNRLMHYLPTVVIIINGRENKFTSAIIITCRPILTSRERLVTYKRLVSGFNVSCPSLLYTNWTVTEFSVYLVDRRWYRGEIAESTWMWLQSFVSFKVYHRLILTFSAKTSYAYTHTHTQTRPIIT